MNQPRIPTEEIFRREVADHQMAVLVNDGLRRHVRFRKPNTNELMFELVSWPGYLCYTGDMGTYVFSRIDDMFAFFRPRPGQLPLTDGLTLEISPAYWGDKLVAESTFGEGFRSFSGDRLRDGVKLAFDAYVADKEEPTPEADADLWTEIEAAVLSPEINNEYAAYLALSEFRSGEFEFTDFHELVLKDYTWHFIWCCYAIVWGVGQFDAEIDRQVEFLR